MYRPTRITAAATAVLFFFLLFCKRESQKCPQEDGRPKIQEMGLVSKAAKKKVSGFSFSLSLSSWMRSSELQLRRRRKRRKWSADRKIKNRHTERDSTLAFHWFFYPHRELKGPERNCPFCVCVCRSFQLDTNNSPSERDGHFKSRQYSQGLHNFFIFLQSDDKSVSKGPWLL